MQHTNFKPSSERRQSVASETAVVPLQLFRPRLSTPSARHPAESSGVSRPVAGDSGRI